jgi:histidinol-phosphatase
VWEADLELAQRMADAADEVTMARFRAVDLRVETKPDDTPVTDADRATEAALRAMLAAERPSDAIIGEEQGATGPDTARRWVIDPIDGTKNYLRGVPVWGTLIALEDLTADIAGDVVVGLVSAPALGRRWWAARGGGAWAKVSLGSTDEERRLAVSGVSKLADASFAYSSISGWQERGSLDGFLELTARTWRTRAYGDFWSHLLVAEGAVDLSAEPEVAHWDIAPLQVILEEAGGRFTDLSGHPRPDGGSIVTSNGRLHDQALRLLG